MKLLSLRFSPYFYLINATVLGILYGYLKLGHTNCAFLAYAAILNTILGVVMLLMKNRAK